ncbi:perforin-1.3 [Menidia menidia]
MTQKLQRCQNSEVPQQHEFKSKNCSGAKTPRCEQKRSEINKEVSTCSEIQSSAARRDAAPPPAPAPAPAPPPPWPARGPPPSACRGVPFVPGHSLAGEGFDVLRMASSGAAVVDLQRPLEAEPGYLGANGSCTLCWNRLLNQTQKLPASVLDWKIKVSCKQSLSSQIFGSSQALMRESSRSMGTSWKVGLGIPNLFGFSIGGSHSVSSKFAETRSRTDKFSFTSLDLQCKYYSFRLHSRPPLSKEFAESLRSLPSAFDNSSKPNFAHFFSVYGTHYIRRVQLGGRVHSLTAIRTCQASMSRLSVQTVSSCLSSEASATVKGVQAKASLEFCRDRSKRLKTGGTFSQAFSDRMTRVLGGDGQIGDVLFSPKGHAGYKKWISSLTRIPGVVSYQINPLHMLVRNNPRLRATLRDAIRDYVVSGAKPLSCPSGCPAGHRTPSCSCRCRGHRLVTNDCCPAEPGLARLNVTVLSAAGLWGDVFTQTDGYVKVLYGDQKHTTRVVWNQNFPTWNFLIRFETVNLNKRVPLIFEVWDRDSGWDDDLLGRVPLTPQAGRSRPRLRLKHGSLLVLLSARCGPSLQGALCQDYAASPSLQPEGGGWGANGFLQTVHRNMTSKLLQLPDKHSLTELLHTWAHSVRQACLSAA